LESLGLRERRGCGQCRSFAIDPVKPNVRDVRPLVQHLLMLPSAAQQFQLEVVFSLVSPSGKQGCNTHDRASDNLSILGGGVATIGPGPKNANASGSKRRMTPLSRSAPGSKDLFFHAKDLFVAAMERKRPRPLKAGAKLAERLEVEFGPFRSASSR
jgi:hypothetical protein